MSSPRVEQAIKNIGEMKPIELGRALGASEARKSMQKVFELMKQLAEAKNIEEKGKLLWDLSAAIEVAKQRNSDKKDRLGFLYSLEKNIGFHNANLPKNIPDADKQKYVEQLLVDKSNLKKMKVQVDSQVKEQKELRGQLVDEINELQRQKREGSAQQRLLDEIQQLKKQLEEVSTYVPYDEALEFKKLADLEKDYAQNNEKLKTEEKELSALQRAIQENNEKLVLSDQVIQDLMGRVKNIATDIDALDKEVKEYERLIVELRELSAFHEKNPIYIGEGKKEDWISPNDMLRKAIKDRDIANIKLQAKEFERDELMPKALQTANAHENYRAKLNANLAMQQPLLADKEKKISDLKRFQDLRVQVIPAQEHKARAYQAQNHEMSQRQMNLESDLDGKKLQLLKRQMHEDQMHNKPAVEAQIAKKMGDLDNLDKRIKKMEHQQRELAGINAYQPNFKEKAREQLGSARQIYSLDRLEGKESPAPTSSPASTSSSSPALSQDEVGVEPSRRLSK